MYIITLPVVWLLFFASRVVSAPYYVVCTTTAPRVFFAFSISSQFSPPTVPVEVVNNAYTRYPDDGFMKRVVPSGVFLLSFGTRAAKTYRYLRSLIYTTVYIHRKNRKLSRFLSSTDPSISACTCHR